MGMHNWVATVCAATAVVGGVPFAAPASADVRFVRCDFSVPKPAVYHADGQDYVGTRIVVQDCSTNVGVTTLTLKMNVTVSNQQPDGAWSAHTVYYVATHDVHDGDDFTVNFPNDDQLIPLRPGGYVASGAATSTLPGYALPQHIAAEAFTWGVPDVAPR